MSYTVQQALEERQKRLQLNGSNIKTVNNADYTVEQALKDRQTRIQKNLPNIISGLQNEYNSIISDYQNSQPKGMSGYKAASQKYLTEGVRAIKLQSELNAYRKYIGNDEAVDGMISSLDEINNNYNTLSNEVTKLLSELDGSKSKYTADKKKYENAPKLSLGEKIIHAISGVDSETHGQKYAREDMEKSRDEYYSLLSAMVGEEKVTPKSSKIKLYSNASDAQKQNYSPDKIEDVIEYLYNGKKGFSDKTDFSIYNRMSSNQINTLFEIYNEAGGEAAEDYLEYLMPYLNADMTADNVKGAVKFADKNPLLAAFISHLTNIGKGTGVIESGINILQGKPIDTNSGAFQASHITNAMRSQITQNIEKATENTPILKDINKLTSYIGIDNLPAFAYQTVSSAVDSVVNSFISKGIGMSLGLNGTQLNEATSKISAVIMGSQVAQDGIIEAKADGLSDSAALSLGIIRGAIEGLTEKYSLDAILDNPSSVIAKYIKSPYKRAALAEGSEELFSNYGNRIADALYYGDENKIKQSYNEYIADGKTKEEALALVAYDLIKEDTSTFIAGAASGGIMNFAHSTWTNASFNKVGKAIAANDTTDEIISLALKLDKNTEAYKLAKEISDSGNMSVTEMGKLASFVMNEAAERKSSIIKTVVYDRAAELGAGSTEANNIAEYFAESFNDAKGSIDAELNMPDNNIAVQLKAEITDNAEWFAEVKEEITSLTQIQGDITAAVMPSSKNKTSAITQAEKEVQTENAEFQAEQSSAETLPDEGHEEAQPDTETPVLQSSAKDGERIARPTTHNDGVEHNEVLSEDETDGEGSVFTNSKPQDIHREPTKEQIFKTVDGKPINDIQKQIEAVCEKFGIKLIWSTNVRRGKYRPADNVILMNPNQELSWMYAQIFKHEFLHYLKYRKGFEKFKNEVFENSTVFVEYVRGRLKKLNGVEFEGSDHEAIEAFTKFKYDEYRNSDELTEIVRRQFTMEDAEEEVLADFVGDMLFGSLDFDESMKKLQKLSLEAPSVIKRIREWLKSLIERLRGEKQNNDVCNDIVRLDKMLERVLQSKELDRTGGVEKNKIAKTINMDWNTQITALLNNSGNIIRNDTLVVDNNTPLYLQNKKTKNLPLAIPISVITKAKSGKDISHSISKNNLKELQRGIRNADVIIDNPERNSMVFVTNIKQDNHPVLVSFEKNAVFDGDEVHKATSIHLQIDTKSMLEALPENALIYFKTKKEFDSVVGATNKLRGLATNIKFIDEIVTRNSEKVNEKNSIATPNKVDTAKLAKRILRQNKSGYDAGELKGKLDYIFSLMAESNWGMAYEQALDVSRMIFEMSKLGLEIADDAVEVLRLIKTTPVRLDSVQKAEAAISYGSYNNFRKRNKERINIKNDAIPLESAWSEWSSEYPDLFDEDLNPADMPNALSTIIDNLKSQYVDFDTEGAVQWLASRILNDAANEMYNPLSKQLQEAVAETEKIYEKQHIEDVRFMSQQKAKIERLITKLKKRRSEVAEEIEAKKEEMSTKQKNIEHIRRVVSRIDRKLRTNSATDHIPEKLKAPMIDFVKLFIKNDTSPFDKKKLSYLASVYENSLLKAEEGLLLDDSIAEDLNTLAETLDGKTLRELSYYETILVRQIIDHFANVISMENDIFIADKKVELDQIGNKALEEITANKPKRTNKLIDGIDGVKYANMTPIYFFNRLGGVFKTMFDEILSGQDKCYRNWEISKTYISEIKEKYHYNDWDTTEKFKLKTTLGETIEITREQAMLLYATAKREYGNEFQKSEHLFEGGIVIEPSKKAIKEAVKELQKEGANSKNIIKAFSQEIDSKRHRITPIDAGEIKNWLTDEQKAYADSMVEYLSKDMAALGNEVSMKLYGINKFNEDYYIPYNSAANYLYSQPGVTNDARLKHQSFTKETVKGANTPLVLSDFSAVCADHINRMCMYNAMTVPLENLTKVFNYQKFSVDENGNKSMSTDMKAEIERAYGEDAVDYILQFLNDMNGNVRISSADKFINRLISKFKKGAVFASASVVVQQPSAIMRAMAYVNPKYFASTTFNFAERNYQEAINYAPVAGIKEMGRFDTGVGAATTNWLLYQKPKGAKNKVKEFFSKDSTYRDDKLSYFAAKADEITWAHIWAAVKAEMKDKSSLEPNSQEFLEACGKRFTEVINYTQVYDSTLSRSQLMRDKSTGAQMITAFMSEPTVSLNLLMNAVHEAKKGTKEGKLYAASAIGGYVGSVILNAILKSLVTAGRDDDEEKSYWEKYLANVGGNVVSDLNPMNLIPVLKDIVSIFEGYTVERADMSLFSDLAQSVNVISNDDKTIYEKIEAMSGSISAFFGLPVKNVLRDCRSAYNVYKDFFKSNNKTTSEGVKYSLIEEITGKESNKHYYEQMMEAADNGDYKKYNEIFNHLKEKGVEEKTIYTGIKSAYKQSKEVSKEAEKQIDALSDNDTYNSFDNEEKKKVENTIKTAIATQNMLEDTAKKHYDDFDRLYEYKRKGNEKARERLNKELLEKGLTQSQINDGETIAKYAYLKSIGIDLCAYAMVSIATNENHADLDGSGGVSKAEKKKAINSMDVDSKTKAALRKYYN